MNTQKPKFHKLRNLLQTQDSRKQLSKSINMPLSTINSWFDQNNRVVPKADTLVLLSKYFKCSVDYLLDLSDRK